MTVTTVRPDGVPSGAGAYTVNGGAPNAASATADNSDTTYIRKTNDPTASIALNFGTFSVASSERVRRVRLRTRARTPESTSRLAFQLGVKVGSTTYYGPSYNMRGVNTLGEYVGPYYAAAPDGAAWDQDRVDSVRVQVTDYKGDGARGFVYELYVDVDLASQPSASVTSPSGSVTDTSVPEVAWEFSDTDGDAQSYYQVKVFTEAQYTASGFNPDETTPAWNSGEVNGSDTSVTVGAYLINGAHRAYVRVAKDVNGSPFWSAWDFESFTIALTPPTTPSVSATFDATFNRVALDAVGASPGVFDSQVFAIERSTDELTWVAVRDASDLPPNSTYLAAIYDYEAPRGGTVYYRARAIGTQGTNEVASDWSSSASVTVTNDGTWWWKAVAAPSLNRGNVRVLDSLTEQVEEDLGVFRPKGRSTALVVAGSIYGRDGSYKVATTGDSEWDGVYALLRHQGVILVQDPFGGDKYVRITSRSFETTGGATALRRLAQAGYVEVSGS
jgi:hypothetical protein